MWFLWFWPMHETKEEVRPIHHTFVEASQAAPSEFDTNIDTLVNEINKVIDKPLFREKETK